MPLAKAAINDRIDDLLKHDAPLRRCRCQSALLEPADSLITDPSHWLSKWVFPFDAILVFNSKVYSGIKQALATVACNYLRKLYCMVMARLLWR